MAKLRKLVGWLPAVGAMIFNGCVIGWLHCTKPQLLGHIIIGAQMIHDLIKEIPDFPLDLENQLVHCILAHHGKLEYGSPKIPSLTEAIILSTADNLDAKVFVAEALLGKSTDNEGWTPYSQILETRIHEG